MLNFVISYKYISFFMLVLIIFIVYLCFSFVFVFAQKMFEDGFTLASVNVHYRLLCSINLNSLSCVTIIVF